MNFLIQAFFISMKKNNQWWRSVDFKKTDPYPYLRRASILIFSKHFLSTFKISKTFVFFLRTSSEYLTRHGQGSVFKIRFQGSVKKPDPCLYFFEYSPDVLKKKTKVLDILNTDKKCFMKSTDLHYWKETTCKKQFLLKLAHLTNALSF